MTYILCQFISKPTKLETFFSYSHLGNISKSRLFLFSNPILLIVLIIKVSLISLWFAFLIVTKILACEKQRLFWDADWLLSCPSFFSVVHHYFNAQQ